MRSGEEIISFYEKKFRLEMPVVHREFLVSAIEAGLKEVYEIAQRDVMNQMKNLAKNKED